MRARGYAPDDCIAIGDSREDLGVAAVVGRFFLVANAVEKDPDDHPRDGAQRGDHRGPQRRGLLRSGDQDAGRALTRPLRPNSASSAAATRSSAFIQSSSVAWPQVTYSGDSSVIEASAASRTTTVLTVSDIVRLDKLELSLAGGAAGLGRSVRWAHISELDDPTPWLKGGELLLTTGQPLREQPGAFVELLAAHELAGLCLGLGFGFDAMPAEAVAAADRLGFPVLTTPYHVPFIAITEAVFTAQADARVQMLEQLTALMLDGGDLHAMLAEMGRMSGSALCLREPSGHVLARTAEIEAGDPGAMVLPVVTGSQVRAELLAQPGDRCDPQLLHHLQTVLAVELLKRRAVSEAERRLSGDLVESILAGEVSAPELRRKAAAFGLEGERPLAFALLRPAQRGTRALAELAERLGDIGPCTVRDGGVAVLLEAADDERAEMRAAELLERSGAGSGGVGRVRRDPAELRRSYDEALYAAEARPPNGQRTLATFRDLGSIPAAALAAGRARRRALLRLAPGPAGRSRRRPRLSPGRVAARLHRGQRPLGRGRCRALGAPPHAALPDAEDRRADRPRPERRR